MKNYFLKNALIHLLGIVTFIILFLYTGPDIISEPKVLFSDLGDTLVAISIMSWVSSCILDVVCSISNYPIFYPENGALFFTENMIGISIIYGVLLKLVDQYNYAYNLTIIFLGVANYYSMFVLMRFLGIKYIASIFSGICFAMTPYLIRYVPHIHLHALAFWPLSLIAVNKLIDTKKIEYIYAIAFLLALQLYFGISLGIFLTLIIFIVILVAQFISPCLLGCFIKRPRNYFGHTLGSALIFMLLVFPLAKGYSNVLKNHDFTRQINDTIAYSLDVLAIPIYLLPKQFINYFANPQVQLNIQHVSEAGLIGITPFVSILSYIVMLKYCKKGNMITKEYAFLPKATLIGALVVGSLMLGPVLIVAGHVTNISLPYSILYNVFPGIKGMRVPVRFIIPFSFFSAIIFGIALNYALNYLASKDASAGSGKDKILFVIVITFLIGAFVRDRVSYDYPKGVEAVRLQKIPKVYEYIKAHSNSPVLELPMWPPSETTFIYFYYQLFDNNPRLGGISSYFPVSFLKFQDNMSHCPDELCFNIISESSAQYLIVHLDSMNEKSRNSWLNFQYDINDFHFVGNIDSALLWSRNMK